MGDDAFFVDDRIDDMAHFVDAQQPVAGQLDRELVELRAGGRDQGSDADGQKLAHPDESGLRWPRGVQLWRPHPE